MRFYNSLYEEIAALTILSMEGTIEEGQFQRLDFLLQTKPQARLYYYLLINNDLLFQNSDIISKSETTEDTNWTFLLNRLSEYERLAPAVEVPEQLLEQKLPISRHTSQDAPKINKLSLFTLIISVAAMFFLVLILKFAPVKQYSVEVATVVDQMNVKWADSGLSLNNGQRMMTNQHPLVLKRGIVSLIYDDGVEVVVEGPAKFLIERSGVFLDYGRLYSRVSGLGIGFIVETPEAQFVDLGTEFGIQAELNGSVELHVEEGEVQFFADTKGDSKVKQLITENNAIRFDALNDSVKTIQVQAGAFVHQIDSQKNIIWHGQEVVNLADVLGGGDGFGTGKVMHGVSLKNSLIQEVPFIEVDGKTVSRVLSKKSDYMQIDSSFIDSYFVPYANRGVKVSSDGQEFAGFPVNIGHCGRGVAYVKVCQADNLYTMSCQGHPLEAISSAIWMHSNAGLTFSLENIQNSLPSNMIVCQFTAQFSMLSEAVQKYNNSKDDKSTTDLMYPKVDLSLLIDGKLRFQRLGITPDDGVIPIELDILPEDRNLTLVITDSGRTDHDWTVFANPFLHIMRR